MVRLKFITNTPYKSSIIFQFHYGTIKMVAAQNVIKNVSNFNSTMVRLKS